MCYRLHRHHPNHRHHRAIYDVYDACVFYNACDDAFMTVTIRAIMFMPAFAMITNPVIKWIIVHRPWFYAYLYQYNISNQLLDDYYRRCGSNWGNVGLALEVAKTSGRHMREVCDYYKHYHRNGWNRILVDNYEIWTTDEVMDYLLVGRNTLYNLLRKGKIKGFKIGSCWKIPKKAVDDYIASESGINT